VVLFLAPELAAASGAAAVANGWTRFVLVKFTYRIAPDMKTKGPA
jgi:hypothetical protein